MKTISDWLFEEALDWTQTENKPFAKLLNIVRRVIEHL